MSAESAKENNKTNAYNFKTGKGKIEDFGKKSPRVEQNLGKISLTEKQSRILSFIKEHSQEIGFPPTVRDIASYFNISAKAAHDHIKAVAKKGHIRLLAGAARGIEIVNRSGETQDVPMVVIPLLGRIAAGKPMLAEENIESRIALPSSFMPASGDMFALKVKGSSMEKAGIFENDIAVLKQIKDVNVEIKNGDIVAALIDGEATLKTYIKQKNNIELRPENPDYQPIIITSRDDVSIMAKLVGIYRKYN